MHVFAEREDVAEVVGEILGIMANSTTSRVSTRFWDGG